MFGPQKCTAIPSKQPYHGALPEQDPLSDKMRFPLTETTGNWKSVELQVVDKLMINAPTGEWNFKP